MVHKPGPIAYTLAGLAGIGVVAIGYLGMLAYDQSKQIESITAAAASAKQSYEAELAAASSTITSLRSDLEQVRDDLEDLADDYRDEQDKNEEFEDQIRDLAGTLGDLQKLEEIDEELLAKYSKVYFLNENYEPRKLTEIDDDWVAERAGDQYFNADAYRHLRNLMRAAEREDLSLEIVSAYRSFDEQTEIKTQFTQVYGSGANAFSADQGYSEHQLGTAVDFSTAAINYQLVTNFENTPEFEWLEENAHKYGFILSYPQGNEFYIYEPWHWRFVGRELASDLDRSDETFYTMDQREINEYLLELFD